MGTVAAMKVAIAFGSVAAGDAPPPAAILDRTWVTASASGTSVCGSWSSEPTIAQFCSSHMTFERGLSASATGRI